MNKNPPLGLALVLVVTSAVVGGVVACAFRNQSSPLSYSSMSLVLAAIPMAVGAGILLTGGLWLAAEEHGQQRDQPLPLPGIFMVGVGAVLLMVPLVFFTDWRPHANADSAVDPGAGGAADGGTDRAAADAGPRNAEESNGDSTDEARRDGGAAGNRSTPPAASARGAQGSRAAPPARDAGVDEDEARR